MGLLDFINIVLALPPLATMVLVSVVVSVITTVVYKFTTNQKLLKEIKEDVKRIQSEIRSTKEPGRAAQLQKDVMKRTMQQFNSSTKSMLITLVPLFLIFGWMQGHLAYEPVKPGQEFTTTVYFANGTSGNISVSAGDGLTLLSSPSQEVKGRMATWRLKGDKEGVHAISYGFGNELYTRDVVLSNKQEYKSPTLAKRSGSLFGSTNGLIKKDSSIERISVDLQPLRPLGNLAILGWKPGWLATYIILSLAASMLLRKWLKVY